MSKELDDLLADEYDIQVELECCMEEMDEDEQDAFLVKYHTELNEFHNKFIKDNCPK